MSAWQLLNKLTRVMTNGTTSSMAQDSAKTPVVVPPATEAKDKPSSSGPAPTSDSTDAKTSVAAAKASATGNETGDAVSKEDKESQNDGSQRNQNQKSNSSASQPTVAAAEPQPPAGATAAETGATETKTPTGETKSTIPSTGAPTSNPTKTTTSTEIAKPRPAVAAAATPTVTNQVSAQSASVVSKPATATTTTATATPSGTALGKAPPPPPPQQPPFVKKRKLNKPVPVTQLLSDHPVIQKTVHNMIGLLEAYGPLTAGQLEYNLPPIVGERVSSQSIHDIVQVLVCTGIVQRVREPVSPDPAVPPKPASAPRYCVNQGVPRADVVLPHQVLEQISAVHHEIKRSAERRRRLKEALQSDGSPKEMLKKMAIEFPEIMQDPVYLTALKSYHIDTGMIERERRMRQQQQVMRAAAEASAAKASTPIAKQDNRPSSSDPTQMTPNPSKNSD